MNAVIDTSSGRKNVALVGYHSAILDSQLFTRRHLEEHQFLVEGFTAIHAVELGCARHDWVLQHIRPQLSGKFTEKDILKLMDMYLVDHFNPDGLCTFSSALCEFHADNDNFREPEWLGQLVEKLRTLEPVEKMALGDALEQAWHRGMKNGQSPGEFLPTLGIELL